MATTGPFNVQIQMVNNADLPASVTQQTQEVVTTKTKEKKTFGWKLKMFYGILAIFIPIAAVSVVFSMQATTETTTPLEMPTVSFLETIAPLSPPSSAEETSQELSCTSFNKLATCFSEEERRDKLCESFSCKIKLKSEYESAVPGLWKCFCCQCKHPFFDGYNQFVR